MKSREPTAYDDDSVSFKSKRKLLKQSGWITPAIISASIPDHAVASEITDHAVTSEITCETSSLTIPFAYSFDCADLSSTRFEPGYYRVFCDNNTLKINIVDFDDRMNEEWNIGICIYDSASPPIFNPPVPPAVGVLFTPNADMRYYDQIANAGGQLGTGTAEYAEFPNPNAPGCSPNTVVKTISLQFESSDGFLYTATSDIGISGLEIHSESLKITPV